ncbi:hypothetical protein CWN85_15465 [Vibrio splendidus]|uniref:hypothetical protein n=1 Tax=Vibrio splendidus TaxID=29497 RepID=UPI000D383335|nr:hypothetical protein [Vibrio splendidus]PTP05100.1 hypothetical protein CWN86_15560 [Vibrio splendidus]PTP22302.1 hypothetical protein CWN85_15465 [Vibrio splendidus]
MSDFTAIGQLVNEARNLLDSIKGGTIRTMQTQFDALKVQLNDVISGANGRLNTFITQQQQNVSTIFADPDKRYQTKVSGSENKILLDLKHLDPNVFYCVLFDRPHVLDVRINRYVHQDSSKGGLLEFMVQFNNFSAGGDFHFAKQLHHGYSGRQFIGKVSSVATYRKSGVWLRGGWSYDLFVSGSMNSPVRVIESDTEVAESSGDIDLFTPPITEVHASVVPNHYILGK